MLTFTFYNIYSSDDHKDLEKDWADMELDDDIHDYETKTPNVPKWYNYLVGSIFVILSAAGFLLNGFVIWCFIACPTVSNVLKFYYV